MKITILGAGAWGTALAITLARKHDVVLWGRNAQAMEEANRQRENKPYLPGFPLPDELAVTADFSAAVHHVCGEPPTSLLIVASSVAGLRGLAGQLRGHPIPNLVWLCKGLEEDTRLLPHQIVQQVLGSAIPAGVLSGPSFAQEVARGLPCALTIAGADTALCERVVTAVHGGNIRIYSSDDLIGVEIGGAVKNILAIATGVADGLQLGLNARAALITRGLAEITRLGVALGGRPETFMGLSGVGDLILTCTGDLSRNRRLGLALGRGQTLQDAVREIGQVVESVQTADEVMRQARRHGIDLPISDRVRAVLHGEQTPEEGLRALLAREQKPEYPDTLFK